VAARACGFSVSAEFLERVSKLRWYAYCNCTVRNSPYCARQLSMKQRDLPCRHRAGHYCFRRPAPWGALRNNPHHAKYKHSMFQYRQECAQVVSIGPTQTTLHRLCERLCAKQSRLILRPHEFWIASDYLAMTG